MNRNTVYEANLQEPVATEVLVLTSNVANMARQIAERLESKLSSVMRSGAPLPDAPKEKQCREYPPLFSEWIGYIVSIRTSLEVIDDCIQRTELQ